ncbi:DNA-dependent metalloprotease SPRTN-like [Frankliniella occidentalis]|uniref:Protein with SprT-like domain at the N terminus n=1 Tax=Frankliniella occidentalis TaxID=133901 RepID=A0A6J1SP75_FRAOC|nr:DNA-dependent metalloprotease SPRTN-like [Frankliniella occidentalis]
MDDDYQLALLLQKEFNEEPPEVSDDVTLKSKNKHLNSQKSSSLVDPQWEFIDPTPDIHILFSQFNERFFWSKLYSVEVKWSPRMTSCAGVCVYQGRSGFCSVRLSLPLLKLRPRKDLVETLLHEMIHAFLFVTKNNRDRDGHGPEFHKHMNRINQEAGTHISVYHSFHDEVRLYQQHWWRCDGPCQRRPPFFGMVRRSMNRAPGPSDNWWAQHEATCGGKFIKVKEPENTKKKPSESKAKTLNGDKNINGKADIRSFFPGSGLSSNQGSVLGKPNFSSTSAGSSKNHQPTFGFPKSGNVPVVSNDAPKHNLFKKPVMNHVHGFGNEAPSSFKPVVNPAVNNVFGFRDMNGQSSSKQPISSTYSGKGHVLGGKGKPPLQNGRVPFAGMLANKGTGTLVVSGKTNKTRGSEDSLAKPRAPLNQTTVFSGTGQVLGKGTSNLSNSGHPLTRLISNPPKNQVSGPKEDGLQVRGEPSKRVSPNPLAGAAPKKKSIDSTSTNDGKVYSDEKPNTVLCPVCNKKIVESVINSHLDDCINACSDTTEKADVVEVVSNSDEVIVLSDTEEECDKECKKPCLQVDCPGCSMKILESELDSHLSLCVSNSFDEDLVDITPGGSSMANCPICGQEIPVTDMDKHLDNCASCSIQDISQVFDEDFSDEEEDAAVGSPSKRVSESGERLYPCPCCLILTESSKMNEHLDQCTV